MLNVLWCTYDYKNSKGGQKPMLREEKENTANACDTDSTLLIGPLSVR